MSKASESKNVIIRKLSWAERGQVVKSTFVEFFQEQSFFHGAALAYYAVFALVPIIYLSLISFGKFVGQQYMLDMINTILRDEVGLEDSSGIMSFLQKVNFEKGNFILNVVGTIALLISSSALLASLRMSINEFFDISIDYEHRRHRIVHNLRSRAINILLLPVLGLLIIVTYFGETVVLSMGQNLFSDPNSIEAFVLDMVQHALAILTNILLFAVIFKYLNDGKVEWRMAVSGAIVTAVLLYLGQLLIKYYLKHYFFGSSIGVPGTILVMLAWMYYSSQIIFLGAKYIKVYAVKVGRPILFAPKRMNEKSFIQRMKERRSR